MSILPKNDRSVDIDTYLQSVRKLGILPGLERIRALCASLGNPQDAVKTIHVAGTNGKGSVCTMIANALTNSGHIVGLYTSPPVYRFTAQFQVNGAEISSQNLQSLTNRIRCTAESLGIQVTEFEFCTALAFLHFAASGCDYAVIETGMGGAGDATNIIAKPALTILTEISLDHMGWLGSDIAAITREKCGILKQGVPCITSYAQHPEALEVIQSVCANLGCELLRSEPGLWECALAGAHMQRNAAIVVCACRRLGLPEESIAAALRETTLPGRLETLRDADPTILYDAGHNAAAGAAVAAYLQERFPGRAILALCGMCRDKDIAAYLSALLPRVTAFATVEPVTSRACPAAELAAFSEIPDTRAFPVFADAAAYAKSWCALHTDGMILLCGSFYLAPFAAVLRSCFPAPAA